MELRTCTVRLRSTLSLEELAALISHRVLGGEALGGREDRVRDEIPAVYCTSPVMGMRFILQGEPDEEGYYLTGDPWCVDPNLTPAEVKSRLRDISPLIGALLEGAEGVEWLRSDRGG